MPSRNATIAQAVRDALNAASTAGDFDRTFTAERLYVPVKSLEQLEAMRNARPSTLAVTVYAADDDRERENRKFTRHEIKIEIGIQARLAPTSDPTKESANAEIDDLMGFAEQIADFFGPDPAGVGGGQWQKTEHKPTADPEHLLQHRVFTNVIRLTFELLAA